MNEMRCFSFVMFSLQNQCTPLMRAAYGNKLDVVKLLTEMKADVNCQSEVWCACVLRVCICCVHMCESVIVMIIIILL